MHCLSAPKRCRRCCGAVLRPACAPVRFDAGIETRSAFGHSARSIRFAANPPSRCSLGYRRADRRPPRESCAPPVAAKCESLVSRSSARRELRLAQRALERGKVRDRLRVYPHGAQPCTARVVVQPSPAQRRRPRKTVRHEDREIRRGPPRSLRGTSCRENSRRTASSAAQLG